MPRSNKIVFINCDNNNFISSYMTRYYMLCSKIEENCNNPRSKAIIRLIYICGINKLDIGKETMTKNEFTKPSDIEKCMLFTYFDLQDFQRLLNQYHTTTNDFINLKKRFEQNQKNVNIFVDRYTLCVDLRNCILQFLI